MKNKITNLIVSTVTLLLSAFQPISAQVPKAVVVEHFTNTYCSVCAGRNPGFYTNLNNQTNVIHLAVHPSSPYSACLLNKHNKIENDGRTNYYGGVYGSTPRLVIQGNVISSGADYSAQSLFNPFVSQTSPLAVTSYIYDAGDSLKATIVIKAVASHSLGSVRIFTAAVEKQLDYSAPNGEKQHYDVFRKSFFDVTGTSIIAPVSVGDSITIVRSVAKNAEWKLAQMYALTIIQKDNKEVVQAAKSATLKLTTGIEKISALQVSMFPNPAINQVTITLNDNQPSNAVFIDLSGKTVLQAQLSGTSTVNISELKSGLYFVIVSNTKGSFTQKLQIINE